jgi:hypothetical protein
MYYKSSWTYNYGFSSASKRIYGSLLNNHSETEIINENIFKKILKWIRKK